MEALEPLQLAAGRQSEELHRDRLARLAEMQGLVGEIVHSALVLAHKPADPDKEQSGVLILQLLEGLSHLYVEVAQESPGQQLTLQQLAETVIQQSVALLELQKVVGVAP